MKFIRLLTAIIIVFLFACSENTSVKKNEVSTKKIINNEQIISKIKQNTTETVKQTKRNIVDYFNLLQENKLIDVPCKLSKSDKVWKCLSEKDEAGFVNECETTVDIKNGYIKIEDTGTGAGILVTEVTLFITAAKNDIIAVNTYFADNILQSLSKPLQFYSFKNNTFEPIKNIFPEISPNDFLKKPIDLKKEQIGTYFELPQHGTTIKYFLDTIFAAKRENAFQKNIKKTEIQFIFNKKKGKFFIKL